MIDYLPELVRAGVSSIRIEARAVESERAGAITRLYRAALDGFSARDNKIQSTCKGITGEYTTGHYRRGVIGEYFYQDRYAADGRCYRCAGIYTIFWRVFGAIHELARG